MGLFDKLAGGLLSQLGGAQGSDAMGKILGLVTSKDGVGLQGLVEQFKSQGMGSIISSWIGTGQNEPITAEQIQSVLGSGKIAEIAQKLGLSSEQTSAKLAEILPTAVDGLTPNGRIEEGAPGEN